MMMEMVRPRAQLCMSNTAFMICLKSFVLSTLPWPHLAWADEFRPPDDTQSLALKVE